MAFGFSSKKFLKKFPPNFGKILMSGVVGSEGKIKRVWDTSQQAILSGKPQSADGQNYGKGTLFLCLLFSFIFGKDGKGMERKRKIKDGHIVVENPLFQELPTHEVTIKSGRTLYRFTGSYDGERSLPHKVLRLMEQEQDKKDVD